MTEPIDTLKIDTPENVTFSYEVAGIGSRFLAALVDTLLIVMLQIIVIGTLILIIAQLGRLSADFASNAGSQALWWTLGVFTLISFVFYWGYYILFEMIWNGQSPGKRWFGLRVIRVDGTPVTAVEVIIRNLVRTLDLLPTAYGVGVITMFINENSRRLGDLAAGTLVVHDHPTTLSDRPLQMRRALSTLQVNPLPDGFPLQKVSEPDLQMIEAFLARRGALGNRPQLAAYLLKSLCERLGQPAEAFAQEDPERVLAAIFKARRPADAG
jgi:uncharacterized RDD family membrane protein YckC